MRVFLVSLFGIAISLLPAASTNAQISTSGGKSRVAQSSSPGPQSTELPSSTPFFPIAWNESLPFSQYQKNDPQKVFEWLERQLASAKKIDAYTTNEERQQIESELAGRLETFGPLAIPSICRKKYDVDQQSFDITLTAFSIKDPLLQNPNPERLSLRSMVLRTAVTKIDTYLAQNAYGATSQVSRSVYDQYVLAYPAGRFSEPSDIDANAGKERLSYRTTWASYHTNVEMPPAQARESEKDIECLAVFSLKAPYVFKFKEREFPTRDLPIDKTILGNALFGTLDELIVYNKRSGEVYQRHPRSGYQSSPNQGAGI